ncbi:MAG TPA: TraB/GumN family protein [Woeseiaceae bacterium]|nr:TraB/GumN family protein [Woeseiaceae bacterium]
MQLTVASITTALRNGVAAMLLALTCAAPAAFAEHPVSMWQVDGASNRIFLLGSVHLLRAEDHPLPSAIYTAYDQADALVMEMDMDDVDPFEAQALISELGLLADGDTLSEVMGPGAWKEAELLASRVNIPLEMLASSKPWLAAIVIEQLMLTRIGFDAALGIESHLAGKAGGDGKEIRGLETIREQLEILDNMSLDSQRALLLQSLEESIDLAAIMDDLVAAWRHGDIDFMETNMLGDIQKYPELYKTIVVDRNLDWVEQLTELLQDPHDYLVIVGALHLIGDQGVPALLTRRGFDVVQMRNGKPD